MFCKYCNKEFESDAGEPFCSGKCGKKYYTDKARAEEVCDYCEKSLTKGKRRFCSTHCKIEWHKALKRTNNAARHANIPEICDFCQKAFTQVRDNQRFCSDKCKTNDHAQNQRKARAQERASTTRTCPICLKDFSPKRSMREIYCSAHCRNLFPKKIYGALDRCFKYTGERKMDHSNKLLGYTPRQLQEHVHTHPNWEKVKDGQWHLDHIFPIIAFIENGIRDISIICCLENLQPLQGKKNCQKNDKYDKDKFLEWLRKNDEKSLDR